MIIRHAILARNSTITIRTIRVLRVVLPHTIRKISPTNANLAPLLVSSALINTNAPIVLRGICSKMGTAMFRAQLAHTRLQIIVLLHHHRILTCTLVYKWMEEPALIVLTYA